jgi:type IV secretory pathway TrbD component
MTLRLTEYPKVLHRPLLYLSGERGPTLGLMLLSILLPIISMNLPGLVVGILLWVCGLPALQKMAKRDPQMFLMFLRHISYYRHCPAQSRPGVRVRPFSVS